MTDTELRDELLAVVRGFDATRPRSLQTALGPSEAGHPCDRRIGYRLAGVPKANAVSDPWAAIVGTATHAWLADAFTQANRDTHPATWHVEQTMPVADDLSGSADLYHAPSATIIDHKVVGAAAMKRYREHGPSLVYRRQVHLYGRGAVNKGLRVDRVAIVFWSRSGGLKDVWVWSEPYDADLARAAVQRLDALRAVIEAAGTAVLPQLSTTDGPCPWCPWYCPAVTELDTACPGHVETPTDTTGEDPTP